jgi:hypothetical protein
VLQIDWTVPWPRLRLPVRDAHGPGGACARAAALHRGHSR